MIRRQAFYYRIEHRHPLRVAKILEIVDGLVIAQSQFILWMAHLAKERAIGELVLVELSTGRVLDERKL